MVVWCCLFRCQLLEIHQVHCDRNLSCGETVSWNLGKYVIKYNYIRHSKMMMAQTAVFLIIIFNILNIS